MRIIVITSDNYRHLMPEFAERFNRYWGKVDITCLCYQVPPVLPDNFEIVSLGEQPANGDWTSGLRGWFESLVDSRFILLLDDYMLTDKVDVGIVDQIMQSVWSDEAPLFQCVKFDLTTDRKNFPHEYCYGLPCIIESNQDARYRTSLQVAAWDKHYFLKFLVPGRTPWEFELLGEKEAMNDGAVILGTTCGVVKYENRMLKGKVKA